MGERLHKANTAIRRRILVADDAPVFVELERSILGPLGEVVTASSGSQAIELARSERPDVLVVDISMPDIGGDALCFALKNDPDLARTRVVLVVGHNEGEQHERAIRAGADDVVSKPIDRQALLAAVNRLLSEQVRGLPRVDLNAEIRICGTDGDEWGLARDISRGGMFIEIEKPPTPQSELEIEFELPLIEGRATMYTTAQVMWRRHPHQCVPPHGMGVRFLKLGRESFQLIHEFVEDQLSQPPSSRV